jgi:hypothetical protein
MRKVCLFFLSVCFALLSYAQDTRSAEVRKPSQPRYQSVKKEKKGLFHFLKKDKNNELKTSQEELVVFRKRVSKAYAENAKIDRKVRKAKKREAKKGEKFHGHKRPPKKRPPGKQKFCNVCKMKH